MEKNSKIPVFAGPKKKEVEPGKWYPFDRGIGELMYLTPTLKLAIARETNNLGAGYMVEVFGMVARERYQNKDDAKARAEVWAAQVMQDAMVNLRKAVLDRQDQDDKDGGDPATEH